LKKFDLGRYQTIYAKNPGSIAAPTAGLHFSTELMKQIGGVTDTLEITLSVGEATFQTISTSDIRSHQMGEEQISIPRKTMSRINQLKKTKNLMAVGTTAVRALETAALLPSPMETFSSRLFIYPGHQFQMVDKLITNFHLPKSSLFILVSALAGVELMQEAYRIAMAQQYRFFSYGDAMLIL
jgi:S-adenosylmethionine:tRNA ribosyltransferase-isomerase